MSVFADAEIEYLNDQGLGHIATVGADGMPHVIPVAEVGRRLGAPFQFSPSWIRVRPR